MLTTKILIKCAPALRKEYIAIHYALSNKMICGIQEIKHDYQNISSLTEIRKPIYIPLAYSTRT